MISISAAFMQLPAQCPGFFVPTTATPIKNLGSQNGWELTSKVKIP